MINHPLHAEGAAGVLRLVLVPDERLLRGRDSVQVCQAAVRGGVTTILMGGAASPRALAAEVRAMVQGIAVPVLLAGRTDVAIAAGAAGVVLGADDLPLPLARRIAPRAFLIGARVGPGGDQGHGRGADFWVISPFRHIGGGEEELGEAGLAAMVRRGEGRPCVAAGGVGLEDIGAIVRAGAAGVAVGAGILASKDPETAARQHRAALAQSPLEAP